MADGFWLLGAPTTFTNRFIDPSPPSIRKVDNGEKEQAQSADRCVRIDFFLYFSCIFCIFAFLNGCAFYAFLIYLIFFFFPFLSSVPASICDFVCP